MRKTLWFVVLVAISLIGCSTGASPSPSQPSPTAGSSAPASVEPSAPPRTPEAIRIGYMPDLHGAAIPAIAEQLGIWEAVGLDVTLEKFTAGPPEIEALMAGDLDVAYIGPGASWLPASGRGVIVTVDSLNTGDFVIAHPDSGITSIADLKGKKVATPQGTSGEMVLLLALREAGLTEADIELVYLDPGAVVTAFVGKQVDAAGIWAPLTFQIKEQIPGTVDLANNTDFFPEYSFPQSWVASNSLVLNRPDVVQRFLEAFIQANDYRMENVEEVAQWTSDLADVPVDVLVAQDGTTDWLSSDEMLAANADGSTYTWFEGLQNLFIEFGRIEAVNPADNFVNTDLFAKAKAATSGN